MNTKIIHYNPIKCSTKYVNFDKNAIIEKIIEKN